MHQTLQQHIGKENVVLQVNNLIKTFGEGNTLIKAVDDVSFNIEQGEVLLIMGPSGSGKTTLLTVLGGLLTATSGNISINGFDITKHKTANLSDFRLKNIGFIFQSFNLLESLTALENVEIVLEFGGKNKHQKRIIATDILTRLGLANRLGYLPSKLSGGEKQRVSIARALSLNPQLILADEPTANLDSKHGHEVMEILRLIAKEKNKTVVIVSHDQRITDIADHIFWLEDGKITEK